MIRLVCLSAAALMITCLPASGQLAGHTTARRTVVPRWRTFDGQGVDALRSALVKFSPDGRRVAISTSTALESTTRITGHSFAERPLRQRSLFWV